MTSANLDREIEALSKNELQNLREELIERLSLKKDDDRLISFLNFFSCHYIGFRHQKTSAFIDSFCRRWPAASKRA